MALIKQKYNSDILKNILQLCYESSDDGIEKLRLRVIRYIDKTYGGDFLLNEKYSQENTLLFKLAYKSCVVDEFLEKYGYRGIPFLDSFNDCPLEIQSHQLKVLKWMRTNENSDPHHGIRGGIIAMVQGTGKTITALLHIMINKKTEYPTLVICDTSLIENWKIEIKKFFGDSIKLLILHTSFTQESSITREKIKKYDIVITTYGICKHACKDGGHLSKVLKTGIGNMKRITLPKKEDSDDPEAKGFDNIYKIPWNRIFVDETQKISNYKTQIFRCVMAIYGDVKYCLTGTPMKNYDVDIWSQFRFCGYTKVTNPKNKEEAWNEAKFKKHELYKRIITLSFADAGIELPKREEEIYKLHFSEEEKKIYDAILQKTLKVYDNFSRSLASFAYVLACLTRLRQVCISPYLLSTSRIPTDNDVDENDEKIFLEIEDTETKYINEVKEVSMDVGITSCKITAIVNLLKKIPTQEKVLIFSKFSSCLKLMAHAITNILYPLEEFENCEHGIFDSSLNINERTILLKNFRENENMRFLLLSYDIGGVGLNLSQANHCICIDPWWNQCIIDQAQSRIYRIGQDKPVKVYTFIMANTIEEAMVDMCIEKKKEYSNFFEGAQHEVKKGLNKELVGKLIGFNK